MKLVDALDSKAVCSGKNNEEEILLSQLIDVVNERFGTDFTDADQLLFDQIRMFGQLTNI